MNLHSFIANRINRRVDFDGGSGSQCVDTLKDHSFNVLGHILPAFGGSALAGWFNFQQQYSPKFWDKIKNTPSNFPKEGDHIFFNSTSSNQYGHCAVVVKADVNEVQVFEQNGAIGKYLGSGGKYNIYDYTGKKIGKVLGWYSFKK